ncbi:MAG: amidohydrolase family protein [Rhodothermia bacterium]|nr:amidohydrolase family protein [Rhodothermia bacterium]
MSIRSSVVLLCVCATLTLPACAQQDEPVMTIDDYEPVSTLVVPEHPIERARYPLVDVHSHQWGMEEWTQGRLDTLIMNMDSLNMAVMVNLSGGSGQDFVDRMANAAERYPGRIVAFANISFDNIDDPDWGALTAAQLEADVRNGARGLKIFKSLGMTVRDSSGQRVPVDDPRIDPVWDKCAELGIPVLIHSADPSPFWETKDRYNERWFELKQRPGRYRPADEYPPWEKIIGEQHNVFRKHAKTTFVNAHLGWLGNNLDRLGELFDEMPNVYTELGAVLAELGRQPRHARQFLIKYHDRILFGKDAWVPREYHVYFRAFETADEYFDYYRKRHAHWKMYGMDLPDDVLRHIYYKNALRIIPGLDPRLFPID